MKKIFIFSLVLMGLFLSSLANRTSEASETEKVKQMEDKTLDLLLKIDAFTEEKDSLRLDSARAHYNMGNIYYRKGEYALSAREYYQAVILMPDDPDSHYNLAYVSEKHLNDFKTALKHYRMYLYLKPDAEDKSFVDLRTKHCELVLRAKVNSVLEDREY